MKDNNLVLTNKEVQYIIDSLIFLSCTDSCYEDEDEKRTEENMFRLELARTLKERTGQDCSEKIYIFDDFIPEDEKEVAFLKESFNIRVDY